MAVRMIKIYWDPVADKYYRNKEDAAQEIVMGGTGGGVWGSITGTIGSQSDLMALLMSKDNGIYATWDGGGDEIDITSKVIIEAVYACTITGWTIIGSPSGSAVVTVKKCTYANYPSGLTAISGTEKPTLSSTDKNQDLTLTTWTVAVAKGDILEFSIDSLSTITKLIVSIRVTKT